MSALVIRVNFGLPAPWMTFFFLALLSVSILMMGGGSISNLYLIWSLQRAQTQGTDAARESIRATAILDELKVKNRDQALGDR